MLLFVVVQVAAALHSLPPQDKGENQQAGWDAEELKASLLPKFRQEELLREASLQDRARCEQSEVQ